MIRVSLLVFLLCRSISLWLTLDAPSILIKQQAFYRTGGTVIDTASVLTSRIGRYFAETKK